MEFSGPAGACVLVDASASGQRLQGFVARAFREQLGRCAGHLHVNSRLAAQSAVEAGSVLVNDVPCPGRHVMQAGELVTLSTATNAPIATSQSCESRSRMALHLDDDIYPGEDEVPAEASESALAARAAFRVYYEAQGLWSPADWPHVESSFIRPLPLTLRCNLSAMSHAKAIEDLQAIFGSFGSQLGELGWIRGAFRLRLPLTTAASEQCTSGAGIGGGSEGNGSRDDGNNVEGGRSLDSRGGVDQLALSALQRAQVE